MTTTAPLRRPAPAQKIGDWLRPHLQWVTVPSWFLSLVGHALTLFVCILISRSPGCRSDIQGDGGESFRDVGIYVADSTDPTESEPQAASSAGAAEPLQPP